MLTHLVTGYQPISQQQASIRLAAAASLKQCNQSVEGNHRLVAATAGNPNWALYQHGPAAIAANWRVPASCPAKVSPLPGKW